MKFRTKVIAGISITLVIILIFIVVNQSWKADLQESQATNIPIVQQESTNSTVDRDKAKDVAEDNTNIEERNKGKESEGKGIVGSQVVTEQETELVAGNNPTTLQKEMAKDESPSSEVNTDVPKPSTENHTVGLYFATRRKRLHLVLVAFQQRKLKCIIECLLMV